MNQQVSRVLHLILFAILLGTCASSVYFINAEPSAAPAEPSTPTPLANLPSTLHTGSQEGWSLLKPGLERRMIPVYNDQNEQVESVYIWRIDQNHFRLDVAYEETPKSLEAWQKQTNALMVVNGGYYSIANEKYFPDGLTIVNGEASGRSFAGYGGMLAIDKSWAEVRWLAQKPYDPGEPLQAALQSFPILVQPGGQLGFGAERENHASARRTAIGQDRDGRILLIVTPQGYFTLHQFSAFLTDSDLGLDIAVNLDGGGSTGILVQDPYEMIPATRPIPFVILVHPR